MYEKSHAVELVNVPASSSCHPDYVTPRCKNSGLWSVASIIHEKPAAQARWPDGPMATGMAPEEGGKTVNRRFNAHGSRLNGEWIAHDRQMRPFQG